MEQEEPLEIVDITQPLFTGMVVYPGDSEVTVRKLFRIEAGDPYNLTIMTMGAHAGTHLDAPNHFLERGAEIQDIPLNALIGRARVLDCRDIEKIGEPELEQRGIGAGERILFKTANSKSRQKERFSGDYVYLTADGADFLLKKKVALVGIDCLSIEEYGAPEARAHLTLLGAGIPILEGLDLSGAEEGGYFMAALPLKLKGAEGAPVRAVLIRSRGIL